MVTLQSLRRTFLIGSLILGIGIFPIFALAKVTAELDRNTITVDQTARLIIQSDDAETRDQPDLSVLNQNFTVLGTSTSQNISTINGKQTSLKRWITELEPKTEGSFTIPSIRVGNQASRALRLTVLPRDKTQPGQTSDVFVEIEAEPLEYYVQQQVNLVIRLYLGINILDGTLSDPNPENTDIRRLGNDVQYEETVGDRNFRVIERKYAIFPGVSGQFLIPAIRFQGVAADSTIGNQTFNRLFSQGKRIKAKSESVKLKINPPDPAFTGRNWLPAKFLEISDNSIGYGEIQVGEPLTRKIQIRAIGLTAEQLPDINFGESPNFKQYPDKPTRETKLDGEDMVGTVNRSIAVIANREGKLTLPSISLNWWNTTTQKMETALLPEKTVVIVADPATPSSVASKIEFPPEIRRRYAPTKQQDKSCPFPVVTVSRRIIRGCSGC